MFNTQKQISSRRKRQYAEADLSLDNWSKSQSSKRLKPNIKLHSAEFYDSLSKVWLTRRALKEFDRRTNQVGNLQQSAFTPRCITRNISDKIRTFAEDGGPDLRKIRGYPAPTDIDLVHTMSSSRHPRSSNSKQSKSTASTSNRTGKRSSAYDNDFEQHLIDHKIYPRGYDYSDNRETPEPDNLEGFYQRLAQPRPSLSSSYFTTSDFRAFVRKNDRVISEDNVMKDVIPIIAGNSDISSQQNLLFTRFDPIANNTTVDAKPDFYDGARLKNVDKRVREDIGNYIIPTGHSEAPVAPNFFLEVKAPKGGADVAKRQACYDGALGARAMHKLQSYKQDEPVYDGNAYTITSTYHAGNLNMYVTHVTSSGPEGSPEYHMSQVGGWNTFGDPDTCRRGFTALRNARDYAQEQRDAFISAANERTRSPNVEPSFAASGHNNASDPADVEDATYLTQAKDAEDDPQYYMSQQASQGEYINNEPSDFASDYNGEVQRAEESELSAGQDGANGPLETTDMYPTEESETSSDELALDSYSTPTTSNKRRNRRSKKTVFKVPRKSDGGSGRRSSKR